MEPEPTDPHAHKMKQHLHKMKQHVKVNIASRAVMKLNMYDQPNSKPECARIGNTMLCTNVLGKNLFVELNTYESGIRIRHTLHGNIKIAACKRMNVFYVANSFTLRAFSVDGQELGSIIYATYQYAMAVSLACDEMSNQVSLIHTNRDNTTEKLTLYEWDAETREFAKTGDLDMVTTELSHWQRCPRLLSPLLFTKIVWGTVLPCVSLFAGNKTSVS